MESALPVGKQPFCSIVDKVS